MVVILYRLVRPARWGERSVQGPEELMRGMVMRELLRVRRHRDQTCSAPSLFWRMFSPCKDNEGLRGHRLSKEVMSFRKRPLQFFWASLGASSRRLMLITSRLTSSSSDGLSDLFQVSALGYLLYEIPVDITFQDEWPGCVRRDCVFLSVRLPQPRRHCPKPRGRFLQPQQATSFSWWRVPQGI